MEKKLDISGSWPASLVLLCLLAFAPAALAPVSASPPTIDQPAIHGQLNPPGYFSDDFYKVTGGPDLLVTMERSRAYQGDTTSLFLTVANRGRVASFQVNEEPDESSRDEVLAAKMEMELEGHRTVAQDVSVSLRVQNGSAMEVKREVAYAGSLREGQVSTRLEFPLEVYENTAPGDYVLYAVSNYTYQRDVAVVPKDERPENPDVYYWYDDASQTTPLSLWIERESGAQFRVVDVSPAGLEAGSRDNVVRVGVKNVGYDSALDLVARLRPESGIYVSVDESPIPLLAPGDEAELIYKVDVSEDAVPGKRYLFKLLFQFSDSYRDDLTDTENVYLTVGEPSLLPFLGAGILVAGAALAAVLVWRRKRGGG